MALSQTLIDTIELDSLQGEILSERSPVALVVPGSLQVRQETFQALGAWDEPDVIVDTNRLQVCQWVEEEVVLHTTNRLGSLAVPWGGQDRLGSWFPPEEDVWELLWALVAVEDFVIDESLRKMVDRKFYLVHDVYRLLWEARFVSHETSDLKATKRLVSTLLRWFEGNLTEPDIEVLVGLGIQRQVQAQERADVLCFLASLASHNAIVSRIVLGFEGLNDILSKEQRPRLKQLHTLLQTLTRWSNLGCPIRVLIGFDSRDNSRLRKLHPKLAESVKAGLAWHEQSAH